MEDKLPRRKGTRLRNFDYSTTGACFITICVRDRMKILSEIVRSNYAPTGDTVDCTDDYSREIYTASWNEINDSDKFYDLLKILGKGMQ